MRAKHDGSLSDTVRKAEEGEEISAVIDFMRDEDERAVR